MKRAVSSVRYLTARDNLLSRIIACAAFCCSIFGAQSFANSITIVFDYNNLSMTITGGTTPWCCAGFDTSYYDFSGASPASPWATGKFAGTSTTVSDFTADVSNGDSLLLEVTNPVSAPIPYDRWYFDAPSALDRALNAGTGKVTITLLSVSEGGYNPLATPVPSSFWLFIAGLFMVYFLSRSTLRAMSNVRMAAPFN